MLRTFKLLPALALFSALAIAPQAKASTILLTQDACTGTCGTGPFGTIVLTQTTATLVTVTLTLTGAQYFVGTGAGEALEFNIAGLAPTIANITTGFGIGPAPATASAFGSFLESVTCTACTGGNPGNPAGPLSFTLTRVGGVVISDFIGNSKGYLFSADVMGNNGKTGNVGALGTTIIIDNPVTEPVSISLMGAGLLMLALRKARTNQAK